MLLILIALVLTRRVFPWCGNLYRSRTAIAGHQEDGESEEMDENSVLTIEEEDKEDIETELVLSIWHNGEAKEDPV